MRLIHLSDLHVEEGPRLDDQRQTLARIIDAAAELEPDAWLLTGDLYGRTVPHRSTPAERAALVPAVRYMSSIAPVVVVVGNHDTPEDLAVLEHVASTWPVVVFDRAERRRIVTPSGPLVVYALPYPTKRWILAGEPVPPGREAARAAVEQRLGSLLSLWEASILADRVREPRAVHVLAAHVQVRGGATSGGEVLAGEEIEISRAALDGLHVDYGALGHLHLRQEAAARCWYPGSPWRVDFGEREPIKAWHVVDVGDDRDRDRLAALARRRVEERLDLAGVIVQRYPGDEVRHELQVAAIPTGCRDLITLEWRWASAAPDGHVGGVHDVPGVARWTIRPSPAERARIPGAEVRARLVVPAQHVASCPWTDVLAELHRLGAHRVVEERIVEPVLRVRAPEVAAAVSLPDKIRAYWRTLGTTPGEPEQVAALALLEEIEHAGDGEVGAATVAIVQEADRASP